MRLAAILVLLLVPVTASAQSTETPTVHEFVYPLLETLTYERVPTPNDEVAAVFAEARRFHQLSEDVLHPEFSIERCLHHHSEQLRGTAAAYDAAVGFSVDATSAYRAVLSAGDAQYAMAAAEQLGLLNESLANRLREIADCDERLQVHTPMGLDEALAFLHDRASDAMLFCDRVAMHFHHYETRCQAWLSDNHRFDGNPIELTGQQRYERSDWARNGFSHIARTRSHDRP